MRSILAIYCIVPLYAVFLWSLLKDPEPPAYYETIVTVDSNVDQYNGCQVSENSTFCYEGYPGIWYDPFIENVTRRGVNSFLTYVSSSLDHQPNPYLGKVWSECSKTLSSVFCAISRPRCSSTCESLQLCKSMCLIVLTQCGPSFHEVILQRIQEYPNENNITSPDVLNFFKIILRNTYHGCNEYYTDLNTNENCLSSTDDSYYIPFLEPGLCTQENIDEYLDLKNGIGTSQELYLQDVEQYEQKLVLHNRIRVSVSFCAWILVAGIHLLFFGHKSLESVFYSDRKLDENIVQHVELAEWLKIAALVLATSFICFMLNYALTNTELSLFMYVLTSMTLVVSLFMCSYAALLIRRVLEIESEVAEIPVSTHGKSLKSIIDWKQKNIDRGGRYEYIMLMTSEIIEVALQIEVLLSTAPYQASSFVVFYVSIISANLIISPILLLHPSSDIWSGTCRIVDSVLDICYSVFIFFVFVFQNSSRELNDLDYFFGFIWPLFRFIPRMRKIHSMILEPAIVVISQYKKKKKTDNLYKWQSYSIWDTRKVGVIALFGGSGIVLLIYYLILTFTTNSSCSDEVGAVIWNAIEHHSIFPNGLLRSPSCNLESVEELDLSGLSLTQLSSSISLLESLKVLNLSGNDLQGLPYQITALRDLKTIDLKGSLAESYIDWRFQRMRHFPYEFLALLSTLTTLDLSYNQFTTIDSGNLTLPLLRFFSAENCRLTQIPIDLLLRHEFTLEEIKLSGNDITEVNDEIWNMRSLSLLDLSKNNISQIGKAWGFYSGIRALFAANPVVELDWSHEPYENIIYEIPQEIDMLIYLERFTANDQQIHIADGLYRGGNLTNLTMIHSVISIDKEICTAENLIYVDFSMSYIDRSDAIPDCSQDTPKVQILKLNQAPSWILTDHDSNLFTFTNLTNLEVQHLSYSGSSVIDANIGDFANLERLSIRGSSNLSSFSGTFDIPQRLVYADFRNTSFNSTYLESIFVGFDCSGTMNLCQR